MKYAKQLCVRCQKEKTLPAFRKMKSSGIIHDTCKLCEKRAKMKIEKDASKAIEDKKWQEVKAIKDAEFASIRLIEKRMREEKPVRPHVKLKEVDNLGWLPLGEYPLYEVNEKGDIRGATSKSCITYAEDIKILAGVLGVKEYGAYVNEKKERPAQQAAQLKYLLNDPYKIQPAVKAVTREYLQQAWKQAKRKEVLERGNKSSKESSK